MTGANGPRSSNGQYSTPTSGQVDGRNLWAPVVTAAETGQAERGVLRRSEPRQGSGKMYEGISELDLQHT